jgi:hypothetical protein
MVVDEVGESQLPKDLHVRLAFRRLQEEGARPLDPLLQEKTRFDLPLGEAGTDVLIFQIFSQKKFLTQNKAKLS